ncbi:DASH complex subunit Ask1-domain-containing protein [Piptocephalis cylindrospora]|uniref:DASH complex subunit ASK1 n=1 Tax=Piptocephalis cylindrospora TaxID=1907219 RepID=A0A4P9Y0C2_9FUNG|nr:DASH complex subunit Ask1-domain-containing protein [Piptocephalis cylindrospora]|eukprot:RKP12157.1 DASH complex subunit Ask1-domain-containing protein [Piptocephalis cylindrospora]
MPLPAPTDQDIYDQIELLEQNITLTLQTIDQNFASCHSVVATKLLPQVDRFAETSAQIWDGCQAWLQFFHGLQSNFNSSSSLPFPPSPTDSRTSHSTLDGLGPVRPTLPFAPEISAISEDHPGSHLSGLR